MKYKGKGNVREYILEMSHLASKLKALQLALSEDLLVHLVLISLPAQFNQFKGIKRSNTPTITLGMLRTGCLSCRKPSDVERYIYVGDDKTVQDEAIGKFRLFLFYDSKLCGFGSISGYDNLYSIDIIASFNESLQLSTRGGDKDRDFIFEEEYIDILTGVISIGQDSNFDHVKNTTNQDNVEAPPIQEIIPEEQP
ncbi:hypothetical protein DKX38_029285 [Salix brachista]|uniref:Uncharacterized protein n=1 Tax=Salix brachista TaxID=2182728 RepID=A0A5N5JB14_9ROSI|nr:hypothetical protein DKX38_029285 [Salix brachista]